MQSNNNLPVSVSSFSLSNGDSVISVGSAGKEVDRGRVFTTKRHSEFFFLSEEDISIARDHVVELGMASDVDYAHWSELPLGPFVARVRVSSDRSFTVSKVFCGACKFFVALDGHELRCDPQGSVSLHLETASMRRLAWVGDVLHHMDVRLTVLSRDVPVGELDTFAQRYVSAEAQSRYMHSMDMDSPLVVHKPLGTSVRQLSTAFEANYFGAFRSSYFQSTFQCSPPDLSVVPSGSFLILPHTLD